jgi:hypothetical protein
MVAQMGHRDNTAYRLSGTRAMRASPWATRQTATSDGRCRPGNTRRSRPERGRPVRHGTIRVHALQQVGHDTRVLHSRRHGSPSSACPPCTNDYRAHDATALPRMDGTQRVRAPDSAGASTTHPHPPHAPTSSATAWRGQYPAAPARALPCPHALHASARSICGHPAAPPHCALPRCETAWRWTPPRTPAACGAPPPQSAPACACQTRVSCLLITVARARTHIRTSFRSILSAQSTNASGRLPPRVPGGRGARAPVSPRRSIPVGSHAHKLPQGTHSYAGPCERAVALDRLSLRKRARLVNILCPACCCPLRQSALCGLHTFAIESNVATLDSM